MYKRQFPSVAVVGPDLQAAAVFKHGIAANIVNPALRNQMAQPPGQLLYDAIFPRPQFSEINFRIAIGDAHRSGGGSLVNQARCMQQNFGGNAPPV